MSDPLQSFGHKDSAYERVGQVWRCDCPAGPDAKGRCKSSPPCSPLRSVRAKRGLLTALVSLGTAGVLLMSLWGKEQGDFLSPGGLSSVHADLENGCASCHSAASQAPDSWLAAAFQNSAHGEAEAGCLACHDFGVAAADMFTPHGLGELELGLRRLSGESFAGSSVTPWRVGCVDCHREHEGEGSELLALASASCQNCHDSHTLFPAAHGNKQGLLAAARRPGVVFDHEAHLGRETGEESYDASCAACHFEVDASATGDRLAFASMSFASQCARCHEADLEGSFSRERPKGFDKIKDTHKLTYLRMPKFAASIAEHFPGLKAWAGEQGSSSLKLPAEARILLGEAYADWQALSKKPGKEEHVSLGKLKISFREKKLQARFDEGQKPALERVLQSLQSAIHGLGDPDLALAREFFGERVKASIGLELKPDALAELLPEELHEALIKARAEWLISPTSTELEGDGPLGRGFFARDLSVSYVPRPTKEIGSQHADTVVAAWAPLVARLAAIEDPGNLQPLTNSYVGRCMKCHTLDQVASSPESLTVPWSPLPGRDELSLGPRRPSAFEHISHIAREACSACHQKAEGRSMKLNAFALALEAEQPLPLDPRLRTSDFEPVDLNSCAKCHAPEKPVGNDCVSCHDFHPSASVIRR